MDKKKERYFIGGPSNSGKSTFILTLVEHMRTVHGITAESFELDVWSRSYPAFRGEIPFADRPKRFGLDWDWKTPLDAQLNAMMSSGADIAFGDMPGKLDDAIDYMCRTVKVDGAIVISRTICGLNEWGEFFKKHGIAVLHRGISFLEEPPHVFVGLDREIRPERDDITKFMEIFDQRRRMAK